jgi:hypothetical protein
LSRKNGNKTFEKELKFIEGADGGFVVMVKIASKVEISMKLLNLFYYYFLFEIKITFAENLFPMKLEKKLAPKKALTQVSNISCNHIN